MMISADQFAHADPKEIYSQMRPDQWTAISNEFLRVLTVAGDSHVDRFANASEMDTHPTNTQVTEGQTPSTRVLKTMDQAVALHTYTRDTHPELFEEVARHPVTHASLQAPGAPPKVEPEQEEGVYGARGRGDQEAVDMDTFIPEAPASTPSMGYPEAVGGGLQMPTEGGEPHSPYRRDEEYPKD